MPIKKIKKKRKKRNKTENKLIHMDRGAIKKLFTFGKMVNLCRGVSVSQSQSVHNDLMFKIIIIVRFVGRSTIAMRTENRLTMFKARKALSFQIVLWRIEISLFVDHSETTTTTTTKTVSTTIERNCPFRMKPNLNLLAINYTVRLFQIDIEIVSMEIYFEVKRMNDEQFSRPKQ